MSRGAWLHVLFASALGLANGCKSESHRPPACTPGELRACAHPCGHGVEQCLESGAGWTECACVILDSSLPTTDTGALPDGGEDAETGDTGGAGDAALDADAEIG